MLKLFSLAFLCLTPQHETYHISAVKLHKKYDITSLNMKKSDKKTNLVTSSGEMQAFLLCLFAEYYCWCVSSPFY